MPPHTVENAFIQIKGNSGYSRHGDTVSLFADRIDNLSTSGFTSSSLALQLWACQSPYNGGSLTGCKFAELPLGILKSNHFIAPVRSDVPAYFPESGDYAIVLVIAEWDGEGFNFVHDFQNYPDRDVFFHPRLEGLVGYRLLDHDRLVVDVECIHNPRNPDNTSGTLSLELWALSEPYVTGDFSGHALAGITLGTVRGGERMHNSSYALAISPPSTGSYTLVLMLREWTGSGYITRDHTSFRDPVTFPLVTPALLSSEAVTAYSDDEEARNAAQSPDAVPVATGAGHTKDKAESPFTKQTERAGTAKENKGISVTALIATVERLSQWAVESIKKQLSR